MLKLEFNCKEASCAYIFGAGQVTQHAVRWHFKIVSKQVIPNAGVTSIGTTFMWSRTQP